MRKEYLNSDEERIILPDDTKGGLILHITLSLLIYIKSYVSVDPLSFEDVEGGFYLLGAGFAVSIFVHVLMIFMIKMQDSCNSKKIMMNNKKG